MSDTRYDAIVVGAGHNGLVTSLRLAEAGWRVLVLERAPRAGGAVASAELTLPGLVHDVFATNCNGIRTSSLVADHGDELAAHGFELVSSEQPFASAFPDGTALVAHQGVEQTIAGLPARDRDGWRRLDERFARLAPLVYGLYRAPLPARGTLGRSAGTARDLLAAHRRLPELLALLTGSVRGLVDGALASEEAKALVASWGLHVDFGPDVRGGAPFALLQAFGAQHAGLAVARGGASRLVDALVAMLRARGGELRTGAEVTAIERSAGRATAVRLASGERIAAERAIVASVTPAALVRLLGGGSPSLRWQARRFRHGPATMMLHLALDGPIPWREAALAPAAYVHLAPYVDDLARTYRAALDGLLPAHPLLVVGQTSVVDSSRSAGTGRHVVWVQVRALPSRARGDAAGAIDVGDGRWESFGEAYADRVLALLESYAPGLGARLLERVVMTPAGLERADPNLVGGDSLGGSMHLRQSWALRPRPRTGVERLWLTGSATWPGAGVTAIAGEHAAAAILAAAGSARQSG